VCKKDIIYILGDITMENAEYYHNLEKLKGIKRVVLGNHDRYQDTHKLLKYVETVAGMVDYKGYILTHAPIHPSEISFYSGNIHAHIHHVNELYELYVPERYGDKSKVEYPTLHKYYNVDAHNINYKPVTLQELCEIKKE
jgi:calcineurin-like phosphoesterase family protein